MNNLWLIIFLLFSAVHLYASWTRKARLRGVTKIFLLPCLMLWYLMNAAVPTATVFLALLFAWIGDLFLILPGKKWFALGGSSFLLGHLFFILSCLPQLDFSAVPLYALISLPLLYILLVWGVLRPLREDLPKGIYAPLFGYLLGNAAMNCFSLWTWISAPALPHLLRAIGAVSFFVSDCLLFHVRFKVKFRLKSHFGVMLTYLIGVFLITYSYLL